MKSMLMAALLLGGCPGPDDPPALDRCENLAAGTTCTWIGIKGEEGHNDDHFRNETLLNQVQDIVFLPDGTAWISDFNNYLVRRVTPDGMVQTMVGNAENAFPGDGPKTGIPAMGGADGLTWELNHPTGLLLHPDGSIVLVGWHNHKLLKIDADTGFVERISGRGAGFAGDGGPAAMALYRQSVDATYDDAGNLYVVDQQNQRIRRIDTAGMISTFAGTGVAGNSGDGGPALMAQFSWAVGSNPNPSGGIVHHMGVLYVSDTENNRIRAIDLATGVVSAFAGTGTAGYNGDDMPAIAAQLSAPRDLEIGPDGDLYFADTNNSRIRAIDLDTGTIRTVVGNGEFGLDEAERVPALEVTLRRPFGLGFDPEGNLYVTDTLNSRVLKVAL